MRRINALLRCAVWLFTSLAFSLVAATHAIAQTDAYPSRPITILVPFAAGGSSDVVMRLVSKRVSESLNQPIVIENRPGGSGNVAAMAVKNAPRDGYLLMMGHTGSHAINATLYTDLKFDPVKGFAPVTTFFEMISMLTVPADSPAQNVAGLIDHGKKKPEGLMVGAPGPGSPPHLFGALINEATGVPVQVVQYRGSTPIMTDLAGGLIEFARERL